MHPQINIILGLFLVIIGFCAVYLMLEIRGNPKEKKSIKSLTKIHKVLGYVFIVLFILMMLI